MESVRQSVPKRECCLQCRGRRAFAGTAADITYRRCTSPPGTHRPVSPCPGLWSPMGPSVVRIRNRPAHVVGNLTERMSTVCDDLGDLEVCRGGAFRPRNGHCEQGNLRALCISQTHPKSSGTLQ